MIATAAVNLEDFHAVEPHTDFSRPAARSAMKGPAPIALASFALAWTTWP